MGVRGNARAEEQYDALHEGVPEWLWPSLDGWRKAHCATKTDVLYVQRRLRLEISERYGTLFDALDREILADPSGNVLLNVVDALLARFNVTSPEHRQWVGVVANIFDEAGSVWRVGQWPEGGFGLARRIDETVAEVVRSAMEHGRPGQHLRDAWTSAYARVHNASHAYREAVRAVEAAVKPIVSPNNSAATLGTMIGDLRNKPEKWEVLLGPDGFDSVAALRQACELIWKSQIDRHGTDDESVPLNVSLQEAQAAVHVAAMLVQLFSTGAIRRVGD